MKAKNAKHSRHWMFKHFMACDLDMDFLLTPDIEQKYPRCRRPRGELTENQKRVIREKTMRSWEHARH